MSYKTYRSSGYAYGSPILRSITYRNTGTGKTRENIPGTVLYVPYRTNLVNIIPNVFSNLSWYMGPWANRPIGEPTDPLRLETALQGESTTTEVRGRTDPYSSTGPLTRNMELRNPCSFFAYT